MNYYQAKPANGSNKTLAIGATLAFHVIIVGAITFGTFHSTTPPVSSKTDQIIQNDNPKAQTKSDLQKKIEMRKESIKKRS